MKAWLGGLACLVLLAPVACGSSSKVSTPQCLHNSDCAGALICSLGYCVTACSASIDCPSGQRCVHSDVQGSSACLAPEVASCTYTSQCATPLVCSIIDGQCRDMCQTDIDCPTGQHCTSTTHLCADPANDKNYDPTTNELLPTDGMVKVDASTGSDGAGGGSDAGVDAPVDAASVTDGSADGGTVVDGDPCGAADDAGAYGPEATPNDDRDHSTSLSFGTGYRACLQTETDFDWYQFSLPATGQGGYITVAVTDVGMTTLLRGDVYAAATNGLVRANQSDLGGTSVFTWFAAASNTTFRVAVSGTYHDTRAVGPYTITVTYAEVVEPNEPNDARTTATALALGTPATGYFFRGLKDEALATDPADYFKVTLPVGSITASVADVSPALRGGLTLYDAAGGMLKSMSSANLTAGADAILTYDVTTAGTYYLMVTEPYPTDVPLNGIGRELPDIATHPYTLTVTSP